MCISLRVHTCHSINNFSPMVGCPIFHSPPGGPPLASHGSGKGKEIRVLYPSCCLSLSLIFSLLPHWSPTGSTILKTSHREHLIFFLYLISKGSPRHKAGKTNLHKHHLLAALGLLCPPPSPPIKQMPQTQGCWGTKPERVAHHGAAFQTQQTGDWCWIGTRLGAALYSFNTKPRVQLICKAGIWWARRWLTALWKHNLKPALTKALLQHVAQRHDYHPNISEEGRWKQQRPSEG